MIIGQLLHIAESDLTVLSVIQKKPDIQLMIIGHLLHIAESDLAVLPII